MDTRPEELLPVTEMAELMLNEPSYGQEAPFNVPLVLRLAPTTDPDRLADALTRVLRSREVTRARLVRTDDGAWRQFDSGEILNEIVVERTDKPLEQLRHETVAPFPIPGGPYIRARVAATSDGTWFLLCVHHSFADGSSVDSILTELRRAYDDPTWTPEPDGYFDWMRRYAEDAAGERGERDRAFWRQRPKADGWPCAPRMDGGGGSGSLPVELPLTTAELEAAADAAGVTVNELLIGALARAVALDHGATRAAVGWTFHGRNADERRICGDLISDCDFAGDICGTPREYLSRVRGAVQPCLLHTHGFRHGLQWRFTDDGSDGSVDMACLMHTPGWPDISLFEKGSEKTALAEEGGGDIFDLVLHQGDEKTSGSVNYLGEFYSEARIKAFMETFREALGELAGVGFWRLYGWMLERRADCEALADADGRSFTYRELDDLSNRIAGFLAARGAGREKFVAVRTPRDARGIAAMLGVWKAGAAFVAVEPDAPTERFDFICQDLDVACVFDVERDWDAARACAPAVPVRTNATDAAFAIYTSGSTGTPKGVVHEFGTLDLNVRSISHRAQSLFRCGERAACIAPMGTVATVIQFTKALSCGAPHVVVPARELVSPERLTAVLARERIRFVFITPNLARSVSRFEPPLRTLVLSSERADGLYFPEVPEIFNVYSASELGCIASIHRLSQAETPCPIGQPTFDFDLHLEEGEICAVQPFFRGYVADLRAGRRRRPDELLHTNDLARLTDDGELVVTGRADDMIKVRGNRVEPAEVERAVRELLPVSWAFVKGLDGEGIALYYQAKADLDVRASRQKLGERLPRYMVPTAFMRLEKVPALPNGKLDRRALPPITGDKAELADRLEALCKSAATVLNVEKVSPDDDLRKLEMDSVSFIEMLMDAKIRITDYSQLPRCTTPRAIVTALQKAGI